MNKVFKKYFKNWSGNIKNKNSKIYYPKNDEEIKELIAKANIKGKKIRVAGSKYSASHVVVDNNENITIVSLEKYVSMDDVEIDHDNLSVTVNAGWKLQQLIDELREYNYLLETQTSSSVFSIGSICCIPAHGGRLGGGIIADSIVAIRFINANGNFLTKMEGDTDFDIYRLNYGLFGIVTHITLKIISINNISAKISSFYNIFYDNTKENYYSNYQLNKEMLDSYFNSIIKKCIDPKRDFNDQDKSDFTTVQFTQCFIDCHNNTMLAIDCMEDAKKYISKDFYYDIRKINDYQSTEIFMEKMDKNHRKDTDFLKTSGKIIRHNIMHNIEDNMEKDQCMFWIENNVKTISMAYFIPVYDSNNGIMLKNLYQALECVMNLVKNFSSEKRKFNIDRPLDLRFVNSTDKCILSPLYSKNTKVYVAIELVCTAYNLETNIDKISGKTKKEINLAFRDFYYTVEQAWKNLGGIPHLDKIFGFGGPNCDPFDPLDIKTVFNNDIKILIRNKMLPLFSNHFFRDLVIPDMLNTDNPIKKRKQKEIVEV